MKPPVWDTIALSLKRIFKGHGQMTDYAILAVPITGIALIIVILFWW